MRLFNLIIIFLLALSYPEYLKDYHDQNLSIEAQDQDNDLFLLGSSSDNEHHHTGFRQKDNYANTLAFQFEENYLSSAIYLIKRFELLIVIKYNTSFYTASS
ncbi:hypothetical protein H1D32_05990 [Anaerobacillus sp. CMMVII]|uniref:hypothetical protein n=1 Tax=Anaerobacillus sp. CMMVII TaxID=2755588 RepID=UPI0021B7D02B|nr:hypothetical protein [Anaerobacillus sp. CMMVII]MCT8137335.1 hypothetical protein [Anaerobacillus sp. CMMVII]